MKETVKLQAGGYAAKIDLSQGANCVSLRQLAYDATLLREPDESRPLDNPYLYGMPILYPVNRISGGSFFFEGRRYLFPVNEPATNCHLHGELHRTPFTLTGQDGRSADCRCRVPAQKGFPHDYEIAVRWALSESGMTQTVSVTNCSKENMPNFLGFHTTFPIPFVAGSDPQNIRVFTEIGEEIERDMRVFLPTGRLLPEDDVTRKLRAGAFAPLEKSISRHYQAAADGGIELRDKESGIKIVYRNDEKYRFRLFYNGSADSYICLEPMTCMANCPNAPFDRDFAGFDFIAPGETKTYRSELSAERFSG